MQYEQVEVQNSLVYSILETLSKECKTVEEGICVVVTVLKRIQQGQFQGVTDEEFAESLRMTFLSYGVEGSVQ